MKYGNDIAERLLDFAVGCIAITKRLPDTRRGHHLSDQLFRSATSGGANYEEARGAESPGDFVHKVRISVKELGEARYWLRLIDRARLAEVPRGLIDEAHALTRILAASATTASRNRSKRSNR